MKGNFALLLICLLSMKTLAGEQATQAEMRVQNLEAIRYIFQVQYAPASWKKKFSGWDLDVEIEKAIAKVHGKSTLSNKDYQRLVQEFFNSTKDYHVGVSFFTTETASLPFMVKGAGNKFFIVYVDRKKLPLTSFPYDEGDEIVTFDGRPTIEVIREPLS